MADGVLNIADHRMYLSNYLTIFVDLRKVYLLLMVVERAPWGDTWPIISATGFEVNPVFFFPSAKVYLQ